MQSKKCLDYFLALSTIEVFGLISHSDVYNLFYHIESDMNI